MKKTLLIFLLTALSVNFTFASKVPAMTEPVKEEVAPAANPDLSAALKEFKSLSRHDRKERIKEAKKELKKFKEDRKQGNEGSTNTLLLVILAILLPPVAVLVHQGKVNSKFWIDLLLTLLFYLPGLIYALVVILGNK